MMFQLCLSSPNCLETTTIGPRSMSDNLSNMGYSVIFSIEVAQ
jgi:hypothetical protein